MLRERVTLEEMLFSVVLSVAQGSKGLIRSFDVHWRTSDRVVRLSLMVF